MNNMTRILATQPQFGAYWSVRAKKMDRMTQQDTLALKQKLEAYAKERNKEMVVVSEDEGMLHVFTGDDMALGRAVRQYEIEEYNYRRNGKELKAQYSQYLSNRKSFIKRNQPNEAQLAEFDQQHGMKQPKAPQKAIPFSFITLYRKASCSKASVERLMEKGKLDLETGGRMILLWSDLPRDRWKKTLSRGWENFWNPGLAKSRAVAEASKQIEEQDKAQKPVAINDVSHQGAPESGTAEVVAFPVATKDANVALSSTEVPDTMVTDEAAPSLASTESPAEIEVQAESAQPSEVDAMLSATRDQLTASPVEPVSPFANWAVKVVPDPNHPDLAISAIWNEVPLRGVPVTVNFKD